MSVYLRLTDEQGNDSGEVAILDVEAGEFVLMVPTIASEKPKDDLPPWT